MGYDLRGGTTAARALGSQGQHPAVVEVAVRQALMQVPELEQQTSIVRSAVQSLNLDPVDPNRLAFHLQSGWSGEPHTQCTLCHDCLLRAAEDESMCIDGVSCCALQARLSCHQDGCYIARSTFQKIGLLFIQCLVLHVAQLAIQCVEIA